MAMAIVEQFGFATSQGRDSSSSPFTSGTTSGTSAS